MKYVMIFLVLTLVVLMADPGESFKKRFKKGHLIKGAKYLFKGVDAALQGKSQLFKQLLSPQRDYNQEQPYNQR
uniref:Uncharacterized protein n=1 Tax=Dicentrarchus labrax TaxID=13489 RepID=A0A8C4DY68_DICLA